MQRYFLEIAYNGTPYHGWQVQDNAVTIQAEVNKGLSTLLGEEIQVMGCGRTDTGVHASQFFLHFDAKNELPENLVFRLNRFLPKAIAVKKVIVVKADAHARFDATSRTYKYHLHWEKDPFKEDRSYFLEKELDVEAMNKAGEILLTYKDFACFSKSKTDVKTTLCDVREAFWTMDGTSGYLTITADRFLRNMVRAVVGTMLEVGLGKMTLEEFHKVIESKDRGEAGTSVPACGLYLTNVEYSYL